MADLYAWQGICLLVMVAIVVANHILERKGR